MKNLRHQNGCHDCLHSMEDCSCSDCGSGALFCLAGNPRPDTDGRSISSLRCMEGKQELVGALSEWQKQHEVFPWSICDDYEPMTVLIEPIAYVLECEYQEGLQLELCMSMLPHNSVSRVQAYKIFQLAGPNNGITRHARLSLSERGFSLLRKLVREIRSLVTTKDETERIQKAEFLVSKFKKVLS